MLKKKMYQWCLHQAHCRVDQSAAELFDCLKKHKEDFDFDESCRKIVIQKEEEEAKGKSGLGY